MSNFNTRWQQVVAAARRAPPADASGDLVDLAQRLATRGLAARMTPAPLAWQSSWRGLAAAAMLFAACLVAATAVTPRPMVGEALTLLASVPRLLPSTAFIPAPPRAPSLDLSATFTGIAAWFSSSPATVSTKTTP